MTAKSFLTTLFIKQNKHHRHGVLVHTLKVAWYLTKAGHYRMIPAALLHDIGKPVVAYQKENDIPLKDWSFTDHEEAGYQIIKNIPFISDYTKNLVRWHYLIRDIDKAFKKGDLVRYADKKEIWDNLDVDFKEELKIFFKYDNKGKR